MKFIFATASLILVFFSLKIQAQVTYTSNGSCTSLSDPTCWTKSGSCKTSTPNAPMLSGTSDCPVAIIINHTINVPLDLNLGSHINLTINSTGTLNVGGNINIASKAVNTTININGGSLNGANALNINGGANLTINLTNSGKLAVAGALNVGNDVGLTVLGDKTGSFQVNALNIGQRSKINILSGGVLYVVKDVEYSGNNSEINVSGFFRTSGSIMITGGAGNELNVFDQGKVVIEGDLRVKGSSEITFGGTSQADIGGNILIEGNAKVIASGDAKVYVCGTYEKVTTQGGSFLECRLLPVEYSSFDVLFNPLSRLVKISWSTPKEWENSHFEIQRAVGKNLEFQTIGEITGKGWSDEEVYYLFEDESLPLFESQVYYRLRQVDFSGSSSLSKVLALKVPALPDAAGTWRAYPNPSKGQRIQIGLLDAQNYQKGKLSFQLNSTLVSTGIVQVHDQRELNEKLGNLSESLPNGMYVLDIYWDQQVQKIKLIISK